MRLEKAFSTLAPAARAALVAAGVALLIRLALAPFLALIFTQDSPSYLRIAADLAEGRGFVDPRLGVLRLPGYPAFLALPLHLAGGAAWAVLAAQLALGPLVAAATAGLVARRASVRRGILAGTIVALLPIELLLEQAVMSEALAGALAMGALATAVSWRRHPERLMPAAGTVALAAGALLTRLNLAPLVAAMPLAALVAASGASRGRAASSSSPLRALALAAACGALLIGPWMQSNLARHGELAPLAGGSRIRLVYAMQAGLVPRELLARAVPEADLDGANPPMAVFWSLVERGPEGTRLARELLGEAARSDSGAFRRERLRVLGRLLGLGGHGPGDVEGWVPGGGPGTEGPTELLRRRVGRVIALGEPGMRRGTSAWSAAAAFHARLLRPLLVLAALAAAALGLARWARARRPVDPEQVALWAGIVATLALHVHALAGYGRFAALLDPAWVVALLWSLPGRQEPDRVA